MRRKPRQATLIPGTEVNCTAIEGGELVQRAYTPVTLPNAAGYIDILIKLYLPSEQFPAGGKLTSSLNDLKIGESIEMKGPLGEVSWNGNGHAMWKSVDVKVKNVGMICAGSGVTPILQVLRGIFLDKEDTETRVWILDANKTEEDICKSGYTS